LALAGTRGTLCRLAWPNSPSSSTTRERYRRLAPRLIVSGWPAPLDPGVELAAYRIVQEALTNARRHAPRAAVDVELRFEDDVLWLRVRDNGPGPSGDGRSVGNGIRGMADRAAAVGGSLRAGGAAPGGFLVEATLPANTGMKPGTSP
jgi:signal transduction histidine kinase